MIIMNTLLLYLNDIHNIVTHKICYIKYLVLLWCLLLNEILLSFTSETIGVHSVGLSAFYVDNDSVHVNANISSIFG